MRQRDEGFTLIELLVVMIIVGILAAIAVPVFLSQQNKARDSSQKNDLIAMATDVNSILVDGVATTLAFSSSGTTYTIAGTGINGESVGATGNLSPDNSLAISSTYSAGTFCIQLNNKRTKQSWKYDTRTGGASEPVRGTC